MTSGSASAAKADHRAGDEECEALSSLHWRGAGVDGGGLLSLRLPIDHRIIPAAYLMFVNILISIPSADLRIAHQRLNRITANDGCLDLFIACFGPSLGAAASNK
jgi:hypothetical protein